MSGRTVRADSAKLSRRQKDILRELLRQTRIWKQESVQLHWIRRRHPTRSDSAAFSRALRRLEVRGLVLRSYRGIVLTDAGRRVAKRLTTSSCSRLTVSPRGNG
jgi:hypothetical protein